MQLYLSKTFIQLTARIFISLKKKKKKKKKTKNSYN